MIYDISRTIAPGALVYPGDPPVGVTPLCRIGADSPFNVLRLEWTTHILTHMDAPRHCVSGGATVVDLPPERFLSDALVVEVNGPAVEPSHVPAGTHGLSLLFRTRHSGPWPAAFDREHVYISVAAARRMVEERIALAGIDYLSVDRHGDEAYPAHRILLGAGVLILEGLDLEAVAAGRYRLIALPLKIAGGDGSPVRAVLLGP